LFGWNIVVIGDTMENTILLPTEKTPDEASLFLASMILMEANQTIRDVHILVTAFLRYAMVGASITNNLMGLVENTGAEEY
jgi:hypothetical protein